MNTDIALIALWFVWHQFSHAIFYCGIPSSRSELFSSTFCSEKKIHLCSSCFQIGDTFFTMFFCIRWRKGNFCMQQVIRQTFEIARIDSHAFHFWLLQFHAEFSCPVKCVWFFLIITKKAGWCFHRWLLQVCLCRWKQF